MDALSLFAVVASAHFLALLSPGPDFVLIVRSTMRHGIRHAGGVCTGIALANGTYIVLALGGVTTLSEHGLAFACLKWGGSLYLGWLGYLFLMHPARIDLQPDTVAPGTPASGWQAFATGFLSGILNPKNMLFYASLFSLAIPRETPMQIRLGYGIWMFAVVFLWDLAVAMSMGQRHFRDRFARYAGYIERLTGAVLLVIAASVVLKACS